jgi:metal-responsive CopG/Arc/MetJ family transcriptional regulator
MRTLVDINDAQVQALDDLSKRHKQSRAALIRGAIDDFLAKHRHDQAVDAFGLWGERKIDGLDYQEQVRGEW